MLARLDFETQVYCMFFTPSLDQCRWSATHAAAVSDWDMSGRAHVLLDGTGRYIALHPCSWWHGKPSSACPCGHSLLPQQTYCQPQRTTCSPACWFPHCCLESAGFPRIQNRGGGKCPGRTVFKQQIWLCMALRVKIFGTWSWGSSPFLIPLQLRDTIWWVFHVKHQSRGFHLIAFLSRSQFPLISAALHCAVPEP